MKQALLFLAAILAIASCKQPDDYIPLATWSINGQTFSTAKINLSQGVVSSSWNGATQGSYFIFQFPEVYGGPISSAEGSDGKAFFYYGDKYYFAPFDTFFHFQVATVNSKIQLTLDPQWFYDSAFKKDSILVSGSFRQP